MPIRNFVLCLIFISVFNSNAWAQQEAGASMNKIKFEFSL